MLFTSMIELFYKQLLSSSPIAAMFREGAATKSPLAGTSTLLNHNRRTSLSTIGHVKTSSLMRKSMVSGFDFPLNQSIEWDNSPTSYRSWQLHPLRWKSLRRSRCAFHGCPSLVWWHYIQYSSNYIEGNSHWNLHVCWTNPYPLVNVYITMVKKTTFWVISTWEFQGVKLTELANRRQAPADSGWLTAAQRDSCCGSRRLCPTYGSQKRLSLCSYQWMTQSCHDPK